MTELNKKAFESQLTSLNGRLRETADTSNAFLGKFLFGGLVAVLEKKTGSPRAKYQRDRY